MNEKQELESLKKLLSDPIFLKQMRQTGVMKEVFEYHNDFVAEDDTKGQVLKVL